jgi:hypothetical protein
MCCFQMASTLKYNNNAAANTWNRVKDVIVNNPLSNVVKNTYSFFYWLPRRNIPNDLPWVLFRNNSAQLIAWYQIPHNLPPYRYLGKGVPDDFFCFGLPGNTLPLGNWDPWFLHQVAPVVVKRYRESELKHGRLAMLGCVGCLVQEIYHPLYPNIEGLAVTHMSQLYSIDIRDGILSELLKISGVSPEMKGFDFFLVMIVLMSFEVYALKRNWTRWKRNEYHHQFTSNIGIGNLKEVRVHSCFSRMKIHVCGINNDTFIGILFYSLLCRLRAA